MTASGNTLSGSDPRRADLIVEHASVLLSAAANSADSLGLVPNGAVVCGGGRVLWVGPSGDVASAGFDTDGTERYDAGGRLVTPGLVDCHAHPLFAGNRADEFGWRAAGQTYQQISAAGGGINATLAPTRAATLDELVALAAARMARALAAGTTTCEAKSGYALSVEGELRLLEVARIVDAAQPVDLCPTLLGAHLVPPDRRDDRAAYVDEVVEQMIPRAAEGSLAYAVDVYCDEGAFSLAEARRVLEAARAAGLACRAHVGQFADLGAAELVAELGGLSADHLENISIDGIHAMAARQVVGVMLPGACVQLRMTPPPVATLRAAGVAMAVATDMNPGTSMCESLPVQMWLATTHYGMTVEEAWLGVTRHAARVVARPDVGVLAPGALADVAIWNAEVPAEVPYHYGDSTIERVYKAGRRVV